MGLERKVAITHRFEQSTPATVWTINHNLGVYPVVDAFVTYEGELQKIIPSAVTFIDTNTVQLSFSTAQAGFATVV